MPWESSTRRFRLPPDWQKTRAQVLARDHGLCQTTTVYDRPCLAHATEVDHVHPGDDHSLSNLRAICAYHHALKSSSEGGTASQAARRARTPGSHYQRPT